MPACGRQLALRAAEQLLAHRWALAWGLYSLGLAAFLLLPLAATHISADEKAVSFGGRAPAVRSSDWPQHAAAIYPRLSSSPQPDVPSLVRAAADALPPGRHPDVHAPALGSDGVDNCSAAHIIALPPRGDELEALALVIPADPSSPHAAALAAGIGLAAGQHLGEMAWLAKDVVIAFVDPRCGRGGSQGATQAWLDWYTSAEDPFSPGRAGLLQQAVILDLTSPGPAVGAGPQHPAATARLGVHGAAGQLPNLDMYWVVKRNWDLHTGLPSAGVALPDLWPSVAAALGALLDASSSKAGAGSGSSMPSGGAAQRYAQEVLHAASFALQQAAGGPNGPHAAFLASGVDAVSVALPVPVPVARRSPDSSSGGGSGKHDSATANTISACLAFIEGVLRTLSNLEERLHHASPLYLLSAPDRVVGLGACLAPPGCLLAALLIQFWLELDYSPPAHHPAWRQGWVAAAGLQAAATLLAVAAAAALRHRGDAAGAERLPSGTWQLAVLAAGVFVALWGWAAALHQSLAPAYQQLPAPTQPPKGASNMPSSPPAGVPKEASKAAVAINDSGRAWGSCLRVTALGGLVLVAAALLLGQWALCYALLLAALPCLLATWQGPDAGSMTAQDKIAGLQRRGGLAWLWGAPLGAAPAGLLVWAARQALGPGWLVHCELLAFFAASQWCVCFVAGWLPAALRNG